MSPVLIKRDPILTAKAFVKQDNPYICCGRNIARATTYCRSQEFAIEWEQ